MDEHPEEVSMAGGVPIIQPPREYFENRGQFIAYLHMVDEVLDSIVAFSEDESVGQHPWLEQAEFFGFFAGGLIGSAKYMDAMIPLASEGVELTASGLMNFDKSTPPSQEEELFWPGVMELPQIMSGGAFKLGDILKRDHSRDKAIVQSICLGTSTRSVNRDRLDSLTVLCAATAQVVDPRYLFNLHVTAISATWQAGDLEVAIAMAGDLAQAFPDSYAPRLKDYYVNEVPDGPAWIKAKKWREEAV